ncbi:MAG: hypothetical protein DHS20C14_14770 [Phycisphaeraceae bacterium]|nr:MAG: hypothetical protein DHS20C14_14770 [Phycisphaeraceae bacterium]
MTRTTDRLCAAGMETTTMNTRPTRRALRIALAAAALPALLSAGCLGHNPGGNMSSNDFFTYQSTAHMPLSVTLVDTRDGTPFWSVDVPVGQKLVLGFHKDKAEQASVMTPDLMRWEVYSAKQSTNTLRNAMSVPPSDCRRLDVAMRDAPEFPTDDQPTTSTTVLRNQSAPGTPAFAPVSSRGRNGTYLRDGNDPSRAAVMPGQVSGDTASGEPAATVREGAYYSSVDSDD